MVSGGEFVTAKVVFTGLRHWNRHSPRRTSPRIFERFYRSGRGAPRVRVWWHWPGPLYRETLDGSPRWDGTLGPESEVGQGSQFPLFRSHFRIRNVYQARNRGTVSR